MANNDQIIYDVAIKNGFSPTAAKLVVAQARFESSDYKSSVFQNNYNTSGMKFIRQPLAIRGTLAPYKERTDACKKVTEGQVGGQGAFPCKDIDHYAKFKSVEDSAKDKVGRLYQKTIKGVTPDQLKNVTDAKEFADLLKKRGYYGFATYGTPEADKEIKIYAAGLKAKLLRLKIIEFVQEGAKKTGEFVRQNPKKTVLGIVIIAGLIGFYGYWLYKKKISK